MNSERERKVLALRVKMWKEIDTIIQKTEQELVRLQDEN